MNNIINFLEKNKIKNISYDKNFYDIVKLNNIECIFLLEDFYITSYQFYDYCILITCEKDGNGFYYINITKNDNNDGLEYYIDYNIYNKLIDLLEREMAK